MKLRARGSNEGIIEKFSAQSSKTAKYAKSIIRKRETIEFKGKDVVSNTDTKSTTDTTANTVTS